MLVTTTRGSGIALQSAPISLKPGVYRAIADARVLSGGLQMGVERSQGTNCEAAGYFAPSSTTPKRPLLRLFFVSHRDQRIKIVLRNWSESGVTSRWELRAVQLVAVPASERRAVAYRRLASPLVDLRKLLPVAFTSAQWSFSTVEALWTVAPGTRARASGAGLLVETRRERYAYALTLKMRLEPGRYLLRFDGKILRGGLSLGAIDTRRNAWIAERFYWYRQSNTPGAMATRFDFLRWGKVELVLGNWAPTPARSRWLLRSVKLLRIAG
jgi:hypothetical protein